MNPRLATIAPSLIRALNSKKTPTSIDLGLGEPTLLPQHRFLAAATTWVETNGLKYTLNAGNAELRELIARRYAYPAMHEARNVCITTGSQEAMYAAIKTLLDPGKDEVLVVEPAYPAYGKIAELEGIAVRTAGMPASKLFAYDAQAILAAVTPATRLIVIGTPSNPTGRVIDRANAKALADGLLARGGEPVWILEDELYRELTYVEDAGSIGSIYPYTIALNGLSKSNALTGLRIGWVISPAPLCEEIAKVHAWMTSAASTFGQQVALGIFREPGALAEQAPWYRAQRASILEAAKASGLTYLEPDGAFYLCVKIPLPVDSVTFAHRMIDAYDVVTIPGSTFGPTLEGWLRLSFNAPVDVFGEGLARIASAKME